MFSRKWLSYVFGYALIAISFNLQAQSSPADPDPSQLPDIIRVCADENGFPPFTFFRHSIDQPEGFNIELINSILHPYGKRAEYYVMPWGRCIAMAERGDVDLLLDVQDTPERHRILMLPGHHYETRAAMIALDESRHVMQMVTSRERMLALDICRIRGWDTSRTLGSSLFVPAGEPHDLTSAIAMLRQGRCDILIYTAELFPGGLHTQSINPADFEGITFHLMPWQPEGIPKFFGVSRQAPAAQAIHNVLDSRIKQMRDSGELAELLAHYLPADY